jgi:hypothetical protein
MRAGVCRAHAEIIPAIDLGEQPLVPAPRQLGVEAAADLVDQMVPGDREPADGYLAELRVDLELPGGDSRNVRGQHPGSGAPWRGAPGALRGRSGGGIAGCSRRVLLPGRTAGRGRFTRGRSIPPNSVRSVALVASAGGRRGRRARGAARRRLRVHRGSRRVGPQQALAALGDGAATALEVVRRYREEPSPLARDRVRGWRTDRVDRVLAGDFDLIAPREEYQG